MLQKRDASIEYRSIQFDAEISLHIRIFVQLGHQGRTLHMNICARIKRNSLNIYQSKLCFEPRVAKKNKAHIYFMANNFEIIKIN
jgi:hypothetical protein